MGVDDKSPGSHWSHYAKTPKPRKNRVAPPRPKWQNPAMNDYQRIAQVIRYLDLHHTEQPNLAKLAEYAGLSPYHFHRLFAAWAGITPKDFLQALTLAHAKDLLAQGHSVLDSAYAAGLSGPGRLHDLCVNLESASPGELKSGGAGWVITYGLADTTFGPCLIGEGPRGICFLAFVESVKGRAEFAALQATWPQARLQADDATATRLAGHIFHPLRGPVTGSPLKAYVQGSPFQVQVWRALLHIQPGTLVSYGHLAALLAHPGAARAVGTAVGKNPLAYLIPCHRVIRETGVIGNYRWGRERKLALVAWESTRPR